MSSQNTPEPRLRLFHLHTYYPPATEQLYARRPDLEKAPFDQQMGAVLDDGYSAGHIFTPYLGDLGYETQFVVANNQYAQDQWLEENDAVIENQENWIQEIVKKQIAAFEPDILYTCNPVWFDSDFIRRLTHIPQLVMGWHSSGINDTVDWSAYDIMLSGLTEMSNVARQLGAGDNEFFYPGFPKRLLSALKPPAHRFDVVFSGIWTENEAHERQNLYLKRIANAATTPGQGFSFALHLAGDLSTVPSSLQPFLADPKYGVAMQKAFQKGRIVIDARPTHYFTKDGQAVDIGGEDTANMRIFEAVGSGCFLLTEHFEGIRKFFEPGEEIETYRSEEELIEKIRYYLDHPEEIEQITQKGQERCHIEHDMIDRAREFDRIIRTHWQKKAEIEELIVETTDESGKEELADLTLTPDSLESLQSESKTAVQTEKETVISPVVEHEIVEAPAAEEHVMESPRVVLTIQEAPPLLQSEMEESSQETSTKVSTESPILPSFSVEEVIERLLRAAIENFKYGSFTQAFQAASKAKALRLPVLNVDYLRAACLLHLGRPMEAREALREELHYFPDNGSAKQLLEEVFRTAPDTHRVQDEEFRELLELIRPHSMVPEARLYSLFTLAKKACLDDLPGNFVECGVSRGGSAAMLGIVIKRYSTRPRRLFAFDSFEGMPEPTQYDTQNGIAANDTGWGAGTCSGSSENVQKLCVELGIDEQVILVKGHFEDRLPQWKEKMGEIALLHADSAWYQSTMTILNELYQKVTTKGLIQFDDYGSWDGCRKAVHEFQAQNELTFQFQPIPGDHQGVWIKKMVSPSLLSPRGGRTLF